ncbi:macrophage migration inhibitory factor homolog [Babylonia areolata]|uniref:macrophage migration inhibitory factor homolog n=1 Tax=Babylonia areolata TaxID=304850 RepID=UPI003FD2ABFC
MPLFVLNTNLPASDIPAGFLKAMSMLVAKLLGKPESYVCVRVNPGQMMTFGGTDAPCGFIELESLGSVGGEKNKKLVAEISDEVVKQLNIQKDRFYIKITDINRSDLGFNGNTFG